MVFNIVMFWWPILISFIFIILQAEASIKKNFLFSVLITIFYTIFVVVTSFELYYFLIIICMFFWLISISVYFVNRSNLKFD